MSVPVFAIALIRLGLRDERARHRRIARVAWPIWIYVSVTGVLIYLLLYPFNPSTPI
jgi:putative membrane protein